MTFRIGDIVKGKPGTRAYYSITNEFSVLAVEQLIDKENMTVRVLETRNFGKGCVYTVRMEHFQLIAGGKENHILAKIAFMEKRWKERYES